MRPAFRAPSRSSWVARVVATACLVLSTGARAEAPAVAAPESAERVVDPRTHRAVWLPLGVTLGWRGDGDTNAFVVGGEVSLVWLQSNDTMFHGPADPSAMYGLVIDAVWVSNPSHFRAMVGAEVMAAFGSYYAAGLEAGVTLHSRGDVVGFRARAFFTLFFPSLYVGLDYHDGFAAEAGILFKIPIRP